LTICTWVYFWTLLCSIHLCVFTSYHFDYYSFVTIVWYQEVWCFHLCSYFLRLLWLFAIFYGSMQALVFFFLFLKKYHLNFDRDCIISIDCIDYYRNLMILIIPIHEQGITFHLFMSSSLSFINILQFTTHRSFTSLVKLILNYFILSNAFIYSFILGLFSLFLFLIIHLYICRNAQIFVW